jgi:hypothetical protein
VVDQKKQVALSVGSFFLISERDKEMHWSKFLVVQSALFLVATLISQFLQPMMIQGQFLIEALLSQRPKCMFDSLNGTLLVSATIVLLGFGSPIGPRKVLCKLPSSGMNI